MDPIQKQAMSDMMKSGISISVFVYEEAIIEITKPENSGRVRLAREFETERKTL